MCPSPGLIHYLIPHSASNGEPLQDSGRQFEEASNLRHAVHRTVLGSPFNRNEMVDLGDLRSPTHDDSQTTFASPHNAIPSRGNISANNHCSSDALQNDALLGIGEWATRLVNPSAEHSLPEICPYHTNILHSIAQVHGDYAGLAHLQRFLIEQPSFIIRQLDHDAFVAFMNCTRCGDVRNKIYF